MIKRILDEKKVWLYNSQNPSFGIFANQPAEAMKSKAMQIIKCSLRQERVVSHCMIPMTLIIFELEVWSFCKEPVKDVYFC